MVIAKPDGISYFMNSNESDSFQQTPTNHSAATYCNILPIPSTVLVEAAASRFSRILEVPKDPFRKLPEVFKVSIFRTSLLYFGLTKLEVYYCDESICCSGNLDRSY